MSRSQREKGKRGEREAVAELKKIGCLRAARRVRNTEGDSDIVDAIPGVSFEVKLEKRTSIVPDAAGAGSGRGLGGRRRGASADGGTWAGCVAVADYGAVAGLAWVAGAVPARASVSP